MSESDNRNTVKRNPAILKALDNVHRSLLMKNLQYDENDDDITDRRRNILSHEVIFTNSKPSKNSSTLNNRNTTHNQNEHKKHLNYNSNSSNSNCYFENIHNTECEKINKRCAGGVCYCFSSDSDDFHHEKRESKISLFGKKKGAGTPNEIKISSISEYSTMDMKSSTDYEDTRNNDDDDDEYFTGQECHHLDSLAYKLNSSDSVLLNRKKIYSTQEPKRRSYTFESVADSQSVRSTNNSQISNILKNPNPNTNKKMIKIKILTRPKQLSSDEESNQNYRSESELSLEKEIISKNVYNNNSFTKEESILKNFSSNRRSAKRSSKCSSSSSQSSQNTNTSQSSDKLSGSVERNGVKHYETTNKDSPAIHIIQELSDTMDVTSKIIINKTKIEQLKNHLKSTSSLKPKRKTKSVIIDDNFCNEILDNLDQSLETTNVSEDDIETNESSFSDVQQVSFNMGKLEANPKYSGKTIGKLFAKRMLKLEKIKQNRNNNKFMFDGDISDSSTSYKQFENVRLPGYISPPITSGIESSESASRNGPKKPPRTFTTNSNSTVEYNENSLETRFQNLLKRDLITYDKKIEKLENQYNVEPSCPTFDQLGVHVGWVPPTDGVKTHGGWLFVDESGKTTDPPPTILNMLDYETNQNGRSQILSSNLKPSPQSNNMNPKKEDIDTVDSFEFRPYHENSPKKRLSDFENFSENATIKSTPEKYRSNIIEAAANFIEIESAKKSNTQTNKNDINKIESANFILNESIKENKNDTAFENCDKNKKNICKKCSLQKEEKPKTSFRRNAIKRIQRTKTFIENQIPKLINSKSHFFKPNSSDSELYITPQKKTERSYIGENLNKTINSRKKNVDKKLELSLKHQHSQCNSCNNSNSQSGNNTPQPKTKTTQKLNFNRDRFDFNRTVQAPSKSKTFNLSPRRLFTKRDDIKQTAKDIDTYKSYADDDQSVMVLMGEFLSNIRSNVEKNNQIPNKAQNFDEPLYEEIKNICKNAPKPSSQSSITLHYTVNDNPNAIYTTVDKPNKTYFNLQNSEVNDDIIVEDVIVEDIRFYSEGLDKKFSENQSVNDDERNEISSYDESKFLREAIGDESIAYDTVDYSNFSSSKKKNFDLHNDNLSEIVTDTPDNSFSTTLNTKNKFNNSMEFYRNVKDKLRSSIRKSKNFIKEERRKVSEFLDKTVSLTQSSTDAKIKIFNTADELQSYSTNYNERVAEKLYLSHSYKINNDIEVPDQYLQILIEQISTQKAIKSQLSNALSVCRSTKEFQCSPELIEAERLILVSSMKELLAKQELVKLDYENNGQVSNPSRQVGTININHIECPLTENVISDNILNYFYICICSYKEQAVCTKTIERNENSIVFRNCDINFFNLEPDYEIKVEIFMLSLPKNLRNFSHESKYHLNEDTSSFLFTCPTPPKLNTGKLFNSSATLPKKISFDVQFSQFKSQGFLVLTSFLLSSNNSQQNKYSLSKMIKKFDHHYLFCLEDVKNYRLSSVIYNSNLEGLIILSIKTEVILKNKPVEGFLTVGLLDSNDIINWNRRWCKLDGLMLSFWNYPNQTNQEICLQIDLTRSTQETIELADRSVCPKPRTFIVSIFRGDYNETRSNIIEYFLFTDNQNDLKVWLDSLNSKIKFVREWKI